MAQNQTATTTCNVYSTTATCNTTITNNQPAPSVATGFVAGFNQPAVNGGLVQGFAEGRAAKKAHKEWCEAHPKQYDINFKKLCK